MVGMGGAHRDVDCVRHRHGVLLGSMELGLGCRDDTLRAAGAGGRPDSTNRGVLSGADYLDRCDGLVLGCCGVDRDEILQARSGERGLSI